MSPQALQRQKYELINRVQADGRRFRTTAQERAEFKAAYITQHARDYDGGESAWENDAWEFETSPLFAGLKSVKLEDMMALRAWSMTPDYKIVQDVLNSENPTPDGLAYAKAIISGFHSLPDSYTHRGPVYSIGNQPQQWVLERYEVGSVTADLRFTSAAESLDAARQSKEATGHDARIEWETISQSGKRVSQFSYHPEEKEVLFMPGTRFMVEAVHQDPSSGKIYIRQREI